MPQIHVFEITRIKVRVDSAYTHACLKELLQHLQFLLSPWTCIFWSDFELQCLVVLWVESNATLENICLEHDYSWLIRVHNR